MSNIIPSRPRLTAYQRKTFAIVASQYNPEFVHGLVAATRAELETLVPNVQIAFYEVPGAFEIPIMLQEVAHRTEVDAIIALGVILQGETAHAELIARSVTDSLQNIALRFRTPVIDGVLLVRDEEQARARTLCAEPNRGTEAARAAVRIAQALWEIKQRHPEE